jgi:hypothetical protein
MGKGGREGGQAFTKDPARTLRAATEEAPDAQAELHGATRGREIMEGAGVAAMHAGGRLLAQRTVDGGEVLVKCSRTAVRVEVGDSSVKSLAGGKNSVANMKRSLSQPGSGRAACRLRFTGPAALHQLRGRSGLCPVSSALLLYDHVVGVDSPRPRAQLAPPRKVFL